MLGVLKCGAAYVPVDKSFPKDRQEYMRADSRAPVIITDDITQQGPGVLLINRHGEILQGKIHPTVVRMTIIVQGKVFYGIHESGHLMLHALFLSL